MTSERWKKIEEIFHAALDCPLVVRASLIEEKCGDDDKLQTEVEKLISGHDSGNLFLESPVWMNKRFL